MDHERFEARSRGYDHPAAATARAGSSARSSVNLRMLALRRRAAELLRDIFAAEKQEWRARILGVSRELANRWLDPDAVAGTAPIDLSPTRRTRRKKDAGSAPLAVLLAVDDESFDRIVERFRRERAEEAGRR